LFDVFSAIGITTNYNGKVAAFNTAGNLVSVTTVDSAAFGIATNPYTNRAYVTSRDTNRVTMINTLTGSIIASRIYSDTAYAHSLNTTTNHLFINFAEVNQVGVINADTLLQLGTLYPGNQAAVSGQGGDGMMVFNNRLFVSNWADGTVSVFGDLCPPAIPLHPLPIIFGAKR
jgi:DNA-binding beta-propeller fold protein YncE